MIAIYEPQYLPGQSPSEPAFRPLKLENNDYADWREFKIIVDMYRRGLHREQRYTGLFSPKFNLKTRVSGEKFVDFVRANAESDVCFINAFPQLAYISFNAWMDGEESHPGLAQRAQALLDACDIGWRVADLPRQDPKVLCYCNFWVGTERFWDAYVGGLLLPVARFLEENPTHPASLSAFEPTRHTDRAVFLPFIVERLFSSFLSKRSGEFSISRFPMDPSAHSNNEFERYIVACCKDEIDDADRIGFFPPALKSKMALLCGLWRRYQFAYYENRAHPHSGKSLSTVPE